MPSEQKRRRRRRRRRRQPAQTPQMLEEQRLAIEEIRRLQAQLRQQAERRPARPLQALFGRNVAQSVRLMETAVMGRMRAVANERSRQEIMRVLTEHLRTMAARLTAQVQEIQEETQREAIRSADRMISRLNRDADRATILDQRASVREIIEGRTADLDARVEDMITSEVSQIRANCEQRTKELVARGFTNSQVIFELDQFLQQEFWRIERAVRTHIAYVFNSALSDASALIARGDRTVYIRWVEHANDFTGLPTDSKTAPDSLVLHGQVRKPDAVFTMPRDERAPAKMWGKTWAYPPNRPNDRAVVMPWRKAWGIPAYEYRGFRRVWLVPRP